MQGIIHIFLLMSVSLLFSTVRCDPNHHHENHNNFPWQDLLSSLGILTENQTNNIPSIWMHGENKEHYTSETTLEEMKSETTEEVQTAQDGVRFKFKNSNSNGESKGLGLGYIIAIPIVGLICFICFCYYFCKCCLKCCRDDSPNVVVMQQSTNMQPQQSVPAPQIILQQPIIHQQAPPVYDASQRWVQPPPQGPHQWNQPAQGPQWVPYSTGQQQHYSPNSGYDNPGFNPATAPPPYNTGNY